MFVYIYTQTPGSSSHSTQKPDAVRQAAASSASGNWQSFLLQGHLCRWSPAQALPSTGSGGCNVGRSSGFPLATCTPWGPCVGTGVRLGLGRRATAWHTHVHDALPWEETPGPPSSWSASSSPSSQQIFSSNPRVSMDMVQREQLLRLFLKCLLE